MLLLPISGRVTVVNHSPLPQILGIYQKALPLHSEYPEFEVRLDLPFIELGQARENEEVLEELNQEHSWPRQYQLLLG